MKKLTYILALMFVAFTISSCDKDKDPINDVNPDPLIPVGYYDFVQFEYAPEGILINNDIPNIPWYIDSHPQLQNRPYLKWIDIEIEYRENSDSYHGRFIDKYKTTNSVSGWMILEFDHKDNVIKFGDNIRFKRISYNPETGVVVLKIDWLSAVCKPMHFEGGIFTLQRQAQ